MDPELERAFKRRQVYAERSRVTVPTSTGTEKEELSTASRIGKEDDRPVSARKGDRRSSKSERRHSKRADENKREKRKSHKGAEQNPRKSQAEIVVETKEQTSAEKRKSKKTRKKRTSADTVTGGKHNGNDEASERSHRRNSKSAYSGGEACGRSKEVKPRKSDATSPKSKDSLDEKSSDQNQRRQSKGNSAEDKARKGQVLQPKTNHVTSTNEPAREEASDKSQRRRSTKVDDNSSNSQMPKPQTNQVPSTKPREKANEDILEKRGKRRNSKSTHADDIARKKQTLKPQTNQVTSTTSKEQSWKEVLDKSQRQHSKEAVVETRNSQVLKPRKSDDTSASKLNEQARKDVPGAKKTQPLKPIKSEVKTTLQKVQKREDRIVQEKSAILKLKEQTNGQAQLHPPLQVKKPNMNKAPGSHHRQINKAKKEASWNHQKVKLAVQKEQKEKERSIKEQSEVLKAKQLTSKPAPRTQSHQARKTNGSQELQAQKKTVEKDIKKTPAPQTQLDQVKKTIKSQESQAQKKGVEKIIKNKPASRTQSHQVKKTSRSQELQTQEKEMKKDVNKIADEEAQRSRSLETKSVDKPNSYIEETQSMTCWTKHKQKFWGIVLVVLFATLGFLIKSLVEFRLEYADSSAPTRRANPGVNQGYDDPTKPSPSSSPSTLQLTPVPPVKIYLEDEIGFSIKSEEATLAIAQLVDEAKANDSDGEVPLTPKTVQRFALINMNLALARGTTSVYRQPEVTWGQFGEDECEWTGVECNDQEEVIAIRLGRQGLTGSIPSAVGLLKSLKTLDISNNNVSGSLPEQLYDVTALDKLFLYKNDLTGTISTKIGNLWNLTDFVAHSNKLSGTIPKTMKSGNRGIFPIRYFNVYNNQMTGTIPTDLKLRHMYYMDLGRNSFSGEIPAEIGVNYIRLRHLYLDHNQFTGTVPESIINAGEGRLRSLRLNDNQLVGALPGSHQSAKVLQEYAVQNNGLTSMDENTCKLWIFAGGELVEFNSDCAICDCGEKSTMCQHCSN